MVALTKLLGDRPILRRSLFAVVGLLIGVLMLLVVIRILLATPPGRAFVEARIEAMQSSGQQIEIDGLKGDLLGRFSIDTLSVADSEGIWLTAKDLEAKWSPWSLIGRHLDLDLIAIEALDIERQPVLPEPDASSGGGSSPIKRYSLEQLALNEIRISEQQIGRDEVFSLTADLDTWLTDGQANLNLTPASETGDSIEAAFEWTESAGIEGNLLASGPEGGVIAELLMINRPGDVTLEASAGGTPENWGANTELIAGDGPIFRLEWADEGGAGFGEGILHADAFAPLADYAGRFGGAIEMDLARQGDEIKAVLTAPNVSLNASAQLAETDKQIPFTFEANSDAFSALLDDDAIKIAQLNVNGSGEYAGEQLAINSEAKLSDLGFDAYALEALELDLRLNTDLSRGLTQAEIDIVGDQLSGLDASTIRLVGPAPELKATLSLDHNTADIALTESALTLAQAALTASGRIRSRPELELYLAGTASLQDDAFGVDVSNTNWTAAGNLSDLVFTLQSLVTLTEPEEGFAPWLEAPLAVSATATYSDAGLIELSSLTARNGSIDLNADGMIEGDSLSAQLSLDLASGKLGETTLTPIELDADLSGTLGAPAFEVDVLTDEIITADQIINAIRLSSKGRLDGGELTLANKLTAVWNEETFDLMHSAALSGEQWRVTDLEAVYSELVLSGDLSGVGSDLAALAGRLDIEGRLPVEGKGGAIEGLLLLEGDAPRIDLSVADLVFGDTRIAQIDLEGSLQPDAIALTADTNGSTAINGATQPFEIGSTLTANLADSIAQLGFNGRVADVPIETIRPLSIAYSDGLGFDGELGVFGGSLAIDGQQNADTVRIALHGTGLDLTYLSEFADVPDFEGKAGLNLVIQNKGSRLVGDGVFSLADLKRAGSDSGVFAAQLDVGLADEVVELKTVLNAPDGAPLLEVATALPVMTSASAPSITPAETDALSATLKGQGELETLWKLIGVEEVAVTGAYDLDLRVASNGEAITPEGSFALSGASLEDQIAGLRLVDIDLTTLIDPLGVEVQSLSANGAKGGSISGSGRYDFDGGGGVDVVLDQMIALQRSDVEATLSGALKVTRGDRITEVAGDLIFDRIELDITKLPSAGYTTLDVQFADSPTPAAEQAEPSPLILDLNVSAPRRVFISGGGLETEWEFNTEISGNAAAPQIFGDAQIVRGDIDLIGRNFRFEDSTIVFNGDPENSLLNIRATREVDDFTAAIAVEGTAFEPEIALTSTPELPEDEVISRVLFGRSPTELSAFEAAQLALAVASLSSGGGFDLVGSAADTLGVDRLDFGLSDSGVPSIGAGKYITPDLYLELRSTPRGNAGTSLEWTPLRSLEVSTELEANEAPRFGIQWKRDFEFGRKKQDEKTEPPEKEE